MKHIMQSMIMHKICQSLMNILYKFIKKLGIFFSRNMFYMFCDTGNPNTERKNFLEPSVPWSSQLANYMFFQVRYGRPKLKRPIPTKTESIKP